jgi:hypothetical protein
MRDPAPLAGGRVGRRGFRRRLEPTPLLIRERGRAAARRGYSRDRMNRRALGPEGRRLLVEVCRLGPLLRGTLARHGARGAWWRRLVAVRSLPRPGLLAGGEAVRLRLL